MDGLALTSVLNSPWCLDSWGRGWVERMIQINPDDPPIEFGGLPEARPTVGAMSILLTGHPGQELTPRSVISYAPSISSLFETYSEYRFTTSSLRIIGRSKDPYNLSSTLINPSYISVIATRRVGFCRVISLYPVKADDDVLSNRFRISVLG